MVLIMNVEQWGVRSRDRALPHISTGLFYSILNAVYLMIAQFERVLKNVPVLLPVHSPGINTLK